MIDLLDTDFLRDSMEKVHMIYSRLCTSKVDRNVM